jgi:DNA-binding transcriptional LysR family regulator
LSRIDKIDWLIKFHRLSAVTFMDIRQLETLLRIVETGSFAAAAETLSTTQSTVSARIRELERSLGVELFDRTQHRARLTPKGLELLSPAREIVALAAKARYRIGDARALSGVVRMGVAGVVALMWLPKLMTAVRSLYPGVSVVLEIALAGLLIDKVRDGELDLALVTGPISEASLASVSLGYDEFVWMAARTLRVPSTPITPAELAMWPVLGLSTQSHHYPIIERWFRDAGADYNPIISCSNVRALADLTLAGLGVSLLPRASFAAEIAAGALDVLNTQPHLPPVEFVGLYRCNTMNPLTIAIAMLATDVSEFSAPR